MDKNFKVGDTIYCIDGNEDDGYAYFENYYLATIGNFVITTQKYFMFDDLSKQAKRLCKDIESGKEASFMVFKIENCYKTEDEVEEKYGYIWCDV